ncbi:class I SAM-dependent methyltransferase [Gordonia sp. X0973]|uniref:class I SAM-dependent methyltransferase n=1 Tax=Gordonia sp. X0973 TaxID=2742602 RepID=UPI000F53A3D4|nr:class I SAM-dependent methyltransferase [Gordonia sp. X0973]QKT09247.1 class I SAM-dependent methyltransferase [Gordonia sp. X0973]
MHQHGNPARSVDPREHWEEFYGDGKRPWSGKPNAILVDEVGELDSADRSALDLGCGSGADAIWLARQGWAVTAVDIADAALEVGREHARDAGLPENAIDWRRVDLGTDFPVGSWDLVSAFYLHSQVALERSAILRRAAAAVRPGGALLVVGHWAMPAWRFDGDPPQFPSTDDVLADVGAATSDEWSVLRSGLREVSMTDPDGNPTTRTDNVVHLRRRS